jgi:hypothetical protein
MRTVFEWWLSEFGMGINLADFHTAGKYPNIRIWLKSSARWIRALRERFLIIVTEILSVPGEGLFLRN